MSLSYEFASVDATDRVLTVTLNRPLARNALHSAANHELGRIFDEFEADSSLWIAILTGAGDKAFCAGADLKQASEGLSELGNGPFDGPFALTEPPVPPSGFAGLTSRFNRSKPVIAAVNGFAAGGGFELALACDIIVASDTARFGLTEPKVGLAALGGGIQRLIREIGLKRANGLLLTGRLITAEEGQTLGFVNQIAPQAQLMQEARRWAEEILCCSPASIRATRAVADALDGQSVAASMETMFSLPAVEALFSSPDAREGPRAFAQRRAPQWSNV